MINKSELSAILDLVGDEYGCSRRELLGRSRQQPLAEARQCAMAFLRGRGHTYHAIAKPFSRDHGTVVHACQAIHGKAEVNLKLQARIQRIKDAIGENDAMPRNTVKLVVKATVPGHSDMTNAQLLNAVATQAGLRNSTVSVNRL